MPLCGRIRSCSIRDHNYTQVQKELWLLIGGPRPAKRRIVHIIRRQWRRHDRKNMIITKTAIPGVLIVQPKVFGDSRGFFTELFQAHRYAENGMRRQFFQDNLSRSVKGTLRGLHFQNPMPQGKLVTILRGSVLDVAVDVRVGSPTFGQHFMDRA